MPVMLLLAIASSYNGKVHNKYLLLCLFLPSVTFEAIDDMVDLQKAGPYHGAEKCRKNDYNYIMIHI